MSIVERRTVSGYNLFSNEMPSSVVAFDEQAFLVVSSIGKRNTKGVNFKVLYSSFILSLNYKNTLNFYLGSNNYSCILLDQSILMSSFSVGSVSAV